jgi:general stress protein 26
MNNEPLRHASPEEMEKIRDLIGDIEVAMLSTVRRDGVVRSRPMGTVLDADEASIWLFISANGDIAHDIQHTPQLGLTFADPERDRYVSVSGTAELLYDRADITRRWRDEFSKWFPGGPDDPVLVLLRMRVAEVEYWDDSAKLMRDFFDTIGAPYSGLPPEAVGEHARVTPP